MSIVSQFSIENYQYLDENGNLNGNFPPFAKDKETLLSLYRLMTITRYFDAKAVALQRIGKMGTFASSLGQEAISVAIGYALHKSDIFCPYYRDQGALYQRGVTLSKIFSFWGGDERGTIFTENTEDLPIAIPIGTQVLHAAGIAYAVKLRKQKRAVLVTCGDGATSESDFYQGINSAGLWNLPLVIIINNNQWAISVPRTKQTGCKTLAQKAIAGGFQGLQVDGNDIIAVKHQIDLALNKARNGEGPTLIEAITYRLCDHTTADDASRYVNKLDLDQAKNMEPLKRLKIYLTNIGYLTPEQENSVKIEAKNLVDKEAQNYLSIEPQSPETMFQYLYDTLPSHLDEQLNELKGSVYE